MTGNKYQELAARTINKTLGETEMMNHALFGLCGEMGELLSLYQKEYQGHPFEEEHAKKECGDILWMLAEYCTAMGWNLEDIMRMNINKLRARYPSGFDVDHSEHRQEGDI
ncbi:MAG: nucleoside triphosphate pyrophosphohydrolase family protein [Lachnospiraceae bacterium]|nr:nucleoside triphosphate pyrophosphohydrolase family protein [Lachnospiraceae bacterium]